jgi:hypothetical protein
MDYNLIKQAAQSNSPIEATKLLSRAGFVICGGAARDVYLNQDPTDIDIFIPLDQENKYYKMLREGGFEQCRRNFIAGNVKLDVVPTRHKSASSIVKDFDCDICMWWMKDGNPIPFDQDVKIATNNRIASFNNNDKFGTFPKRAGKLYNNGWTIKKIAQQWEEYTYDTKDEAEKTYKALGYDQSDIDEILGDWEPGSSYTDVWILDFDVGEGDVDVYDIDGNLVDLEKGHHKITIETRYGYVDAWLDDLYQIVPKDAKQDLGAPRVDRSRLEAVKRQVEKWLKDVGVSYIAEEAESKELEQQDWICACGESNEAGYPCWKCAGPESGAVGYQPKRAKTMQQAMNELACKYFRNGDRGFNPKFDKMAAISPKFPEEIWAQLMVEALAGFNEGLENRIDIEDHRAAQKLHEDATNLVGPEAFHTIAFLITAQQERDIPGFEQAFQRAQEPVQELGIQTPELDLTLYLQNDVDRQVYGQYGTYIADIMNRPMTQQLASHTRQYLQQLSKTTGLSREFASAMGSLGAEYQKIEDQLTRQSAEGLVQEQLPGGWETGVEEGLGKIQGRHMVAMVHRRFAEKIYI